MEGHFLQGTFLPVFINVGTKIQLLLYINNQLTPAVWKKRTALQLIQKDSVQIILCVNCYSIRTPQNNLL